jgi:hypothetical protein
MDRPNLEAGATTDPLSPRVYRVSWEPGRHSAPIDSSQARSQGQNIVAKDLVVGQYQHHVVTVNVIMNIGSRIRRAFGSANWLLLGSFCAVFFAAGVGHVFAQARRVAAEREASWLWETINGWGLIGVVYTILHAHPEIYMYALGAIVTIGGVILAGKAATKPGTLQIGKKKLRVTGVAAFMVCAAGILIIVFGYLKA